MIGQVTFPDGKSLILQDDLELSSDDPALLEAFRPRWQWHLEQEYSPAIGPLGASFLEQLAKKFGGKAAFLGREEDDEEVIY